MPKYDYVCQSCAKKARLYFSYSEYGKVTAVCPHCKSNHLKRHIGRVALGQSDASRVDTLMDNNLAALDGDDPQELGSFMRKMGRELGEDLGDDFNEVVDRLEKGQSPEKIEEAMPELKERDQ